MDRHFYENEIIKKVAGPYLKGQYPMPTHRFFQGIILTLFKTILNILRLQKRQCDDDLVGEI